MAQFDQGSAAELASRAMAELYRRYGSDLLAWLTARYGQQAEEFAQETWLRVIRELRRGPGPMPNFRGWLWTVARNLTVDELRRRRSIRLEAVAEPLGNSHDPARRSEQAEREQVMRRCFEVLQRQKPDHAAVVQAFLDGEAVVTAAERLGISRAAFDKRKQRALEALQECVEGQLP
jgi:RNA polymerase sigma-70 factor (ECF subfamily)